MVMIIHPHQGVGPIRFGMSRAEVEKAIGVIPKRLRRSKYDLSELDFFDVPELTVGYDANEHCDSVEFTRGFGTELEYDGFRLFHHSARAVRDWALARDPQLNPKHGFTSKALGLGMWADWIDDPNLAPDELQEPGMSFIIFRPGYYEEEHARMVAAGLIPD